MLSIHNLELYHLTIHLISNNMLFYFEDWFHFISGINIVNVHLLKSNCWKCKYVDCRYDSIIMDLQELEFLWKFWLVVRHIMHWLDFFWFWYFNFLNSCGLVQKISRNFLGIIFCRIVNFPKCINYKWKIFLEVWNQTKYSTYHPTLEK